MELIGEIEHLFKESGSFCFQAAVRSFLGSSGDLQNKTQNLAFCRYVILHATFDEGADNFLEVKKM